MDDILIVLENLLFHTDGRHPRLRGDGESRR